jgi:hypothetical protein
MKPILCDSYAPAVKDSASRECTHRAHTYRLDADTRRPHQPLQNGQQVTVRATETNGTDDATAVLPAR